MKLSNLVLLSFSAVQTSFAQCPVPPTAIDFAIEAQVQFDSATKEYEYTYRVSNGPKAQLEVFMFIIETPQDVFLIEAPRMWKKKFRPGGENKPSGINFSSTTSDILRRNSKQVAFKIKSKLPPGTARYYAEGSPDDQLKAVVVNNDTEVAPSCPGFYTEAKSTLDQMVTGTTVGPVPATQAEVKLKMKVKKHQGAGVTDIEYDEPEISSVDKGEVELIIFGAKDLDLKNIDLKSLRFGPVGTSPTSVVLVEKHNKAKVYHWKKAPSDEKAMILATFNLADLQIRCDLDKALFLKAKAGAKEIIGSVKMKPVMCGPQIWKQMGIERKWPRHEVQ